MSTPAPPPPPPESRRPFQFSMATLLGVMTIACIGLALLVVMPEWIALTGLAVFEAAFIAFLVAGAIFAASNGRAFCIGALAAHWFAQTATSYVSNSISFWQFTPLIAIQQVGTQTLLDLFAGWVCIRARRYWEQRDQ